MSTPSTTTVYSSTPSPVSREELAEYFSEEAKKAATTTLATAMINISIKHYQVRGEIDTNLISDGYHTFGELYEHRITLFIALCKVLAKIYDECSEQLPWCDVWRSKKHSDESEWEGWFLLGIDQAAGHQITYHLPISKWEETNFAKTLDKAPEFDGHTSQDVLDRLKQL